MSSQRQLQANRRNAQQSTGPQTPEGKAVCAANALTHGFSALSAVLPSESSKEFQTLLAKLQDEFQPETTLEQSLVRHLADADWRLRRVASFESALLLQRLEKARRDCAEYPDELPDDPALTEICLLGQALIDDADGSDPLSKLSRYEARLTRRYFKALAQLRKVQQQRRRAATHALSSEPNSGQPGNGLAVGHQSAAPPARDDTKK